MMWAGVALLAIGIALAIFKGWVVWNVAHDGWGAPTLDFPLFYPLPLATGAFVVASSVAGQPVPAVGLTVYFGLAVCFGVLLWLFNRIGELKRQR